jgi:hypothetical protein
MTTNEHKQAHVEGLATLLVLSDEIRKLTTIREFGFFTTNETHRLIPYHTAYLWQRKEVLGIQLLAQSGAAELDVHASINQWLNKKIERIASASKSTEVHQVNLVEVERGIVDHSETFEWKEFLPEYLLWCPLLNKANHLNGGLILLRETPFSDAEIKMLHWLIASYQYTWVMLHKSKKLPTWASVKNKPYIITLGIVITCIVFFPVRLSVLGIATVVPKNPVLINAPMDGVIKSFAVSPGQQVVAGQLLLSLDKSDLIANNDVNKKEVMLTEAKLRTVINKGFEDKEISAEVPILKAQLAIDYEHMNYTNSLLEKADIKSPIAGIVVFDSKEDWIGQPVKTGERILVVADPNQVELKIMLPIANSIKLETGSEADFFLYGRLSSITVKLQTLGYNAKLMPNKVLAYELSADFVNKKNMPQLGAQGTVRLYGSRVPLIYYFIRHPLQGLRQMWGF